MDADRPDPDPRDHRLPQEQLTGLILAGRALPASSPILMLGPLSAKTYALLATFALGLATFRAEGKSEPPIVDA